MKAVLLAAMCGCVCVEGFVIYTSLMVGPVVNVVPRAAMPSFSMQAEGYAHADRRALLLRGVIAGLGVGMGTTGASANEDQQVKSERKPQFRRLPRIQFIAALGDPAASSGTGADTWGLWEEDPGPRGVNLRSYPKLEKASGKAPAGWKFDKSDWWLEEHGLIMEAPGKLPAKKFVRDGLQGTGKGTTVERAKYVVTGDRDLTTVLTVYSDGRWELDKGSLFDVTHLPCRSARYTPDADQTCAPDQAKPSEFPVTPGASMPMVTGCKKQDYAVLFVLGAEK